MLAFIGLGAFLDRWLELPGIALVTLGFCMKMAREERVMNAEFGQNYTDYSRATRRLIPFVW
jgi:protein-S-isoprenylcysteine O-methyltransferase Ste14